MENLPLKQLAAATGWVRGTRLKFSKESLSIALPAEDARSAPYELVKRDSKGWTIRLKPVSQGAAKAGDAAMAPHEMKPSLHEDDRLAWDIGDGRRILLRRETR